MSYEQIQQTPWNEAAYKAQAELAEQGIEIEVKSVDEILADHQAQHGIETDEMDDDYEPDPLAMMVDWMDELAELAEEIPTQPSHYGWLVTDKVRDKLRDAYTEVKIYVQEQAETEQ